MGDSSASKEKGSYHDRRDQRAHSPRRSRSTKSRSTRVDGSRHWRRSASTFREATSTYERSPSTYRGPPSNYRQWLRPCSSSRWSRSPYRHQSCRARSRQWSRPSSSPRRSRSPYKHHSCRARSPPRRDRGHGVGAEKIGSGSQEGGRTLYPRISWKGSGTIISFLTMEY